MIKRSADYGGEIRAPGSLRAMASSAWKIGGEPRSSSTTKPARTKAPVAESEPPAAPPPKKDYYEDLLKSLHNPQRGARISVPGS